MAGGGDGFDQGQPAAPQGPTAAERATMSLQSQAAQHQMPNTNVYQSSYQQPQQYSNLSAWQPQQMNYGYNPFGGMQQGFGGMYNPFSYGGMQQGYGGMQQGFGGMYNPFSYGGMQQGYGGMYNPFGYGQGMGGYGMQAPFGGYGMQAPFGGYQQGGFGYGNAEVQRPPMARGQGGFQHETPKPMPQFSQQNPWDNGFPRVAPEVQVLPAASVNV
jgi:hypothetical protein